MEVSNPDFYSQDEDTIKKVTAELAQIEKELQGKYDRWDELEAKD